MHRLSCTDSYPALPNPALSCLTGQEWGAQDLAAAGNEEAARHKHTPPLTGYLSCSAAPMSFVCVPFLNSTGVANNRPPSCVKCKHNALTY